MRPLQRLSDLLFGRARLTLGDIEAGRPTPRDARQIAWLNGEIEWHTQHGQGDTQYVRRLRRERERLRNG